MGGASDVDFKKEHHYGTWLIRVTLDDVSSWRSSLRYVPTEGPQDTSPVAEQPVLKGRRLVRST